MAVSVTFWRFPEEEDVFIRFLDASGPIVAMPKGKVRDKSVLVPLPLRDLLARDPASIVMWLRDSIEELPIKTFPDDAGESYAIRWPMLPVLTYRRGRPQAANQLSASHISGDWTYLSEDQTAILDRPAEFVRWGRKVLGWVRRQTPEWHQYRGYRVTTKVAEAIKSGLQIVP